MAAQGFFVGALAVAISKTSTLTSTSSLYVNVEAHSIAFSALYFWIIPAVFLSAIIGVSQTEKNIGRILGVLETKLKLRTGLKHIQLPSPYTTNDEKTVRIVSGGIYAWQPESKTPQKPKGLWHSVKVSVKVNCLPFFTVSSGTITAMLVSGFVPAEGWQPRHFAYSSFLSIWIFSFLATNWMKPQEEYKKQPGNNKKHLGDINSQRFWITFAKDIVVTVGTLAALMYIQIGPFNNCSSYTLWGRKGLALPGMPEVEAILNSRIKDVYPAIAFISIGIQVVLIPFVVFMRNRRALRVLLQSDDGLSLWPAWLKRPLFKNSGYHEISPRHSLELPPMVHEVSPDEFNAENWLKSAGINLDEGGEIGRARTEYSKILLLLFPRPLLIQLSKPSARSV
jgi:hypothetical protein